MKFDKLTEAYMEVVKPQAQVDLKKLNLKQLEELKWKTIEKHKAELHEILKQIEIIRYEQDLSRANTEFAVKKKL